MDKLIYSELILFCISVLVILLWNDSRHERGPMLIGQGVFRYLMIVNIVAMSFDIAAICCNGIQGAGSRILMYTSLCLYYMSHSLVIYLFMLYIDFELYPDKDRFKKRLPYYSVFTAINLLMSASSLYTGWFYIIDENNYYHRGSIWWVPAVLSFAYAIYAMSMVLNWAKKNRLNSKSEKELFGRLFLLPILPCLGYLIQGALPGTAWIFPCTTLTILINYIAIQNGQMSRDHLTGLYNRGHLETFINNQIRNLKKGNSAFLILLDLDYFKAINDTYGHLTGDDALISAAKLLRDHCKRKRDFVVRLGGDEFVIIGKCEDVSTVQKIIERMNKEIADFNAKGKKPYQLSFSVGYAIGEAGTNTTLDKLINVADQMMYKNKREKKKRREKS